MSSSTVRSRVKFAPWRLLTVSAIGAVVVAAVALPVLIALATKLTVAEDDLTRADLIYVLNGRFAARVDLTAQLYHQGMGNRIRIARTREVDRHWRGRVTIPLSEQMGIMIVERGVPQDIVAEIPFAGGVVNTRDEAIALRRLVEKEWIRRVIVVSSDHHTGRARRILRQELRGFGVNLQMAGAPDVNGFSPDNWWRSAMGRRIYAVELLKHLGALFRLDRWYRATS